jgi:hypothetical protein
MGFSSARYGRQAVEEKRRKIHPIWRGIGCVLLFLVPIISFYLARLFMAAAIVPLPIELSKPVILSFYNIGPIDSTIYRINEVFNGELLYGDLFFTIIFMVLGFGVLSIVYGIIYRLIGPPRYGPLDAPEAERKQRRTY